MVISGNIPPPDPPDPAGPYFTTSAPSSGVALARDHWFASGVYAAPDAMLPIGIAFPAGSLPRERGDAAAVFRLVVGQVELEGRFIVVDRRFVRLGEAALIHP